METLKKGVVSGNSISEKEETSKYRKYAQNRQEKFRKQAGKEKEKIICRAEMQRKNFTITHLHF